MCDFESFLETGPEQNSGPRNTTRGRRSVTPHEALFQNDDYSPKTQ